MQPRQSLSQPASIRRTPPARALEWAAAAVGDGARVTAVRRLRGGTSAAVHALTVEDAGGHAHRLVLRRFVDAGWLAREPDLAAHEAAALRLLAASEVPAPRLVASDVGGAVADVPAVLMTRLPGRLDLAPRDLDAHVRGLAALLPGVHAVRGSSELPAYRRYASDPDVPPAGAHHLEAWRAIIVRAAEAPPSGGATFIHRDFHPGNVLWARGRISGLVDWVNACIGPAEVDVGHARWNLALLHGIEVADVFLGCWLAEAGRVEHDPYWDIVCLLDAGDLDGALRGWHDAGRRDLTLEVVTRRRDAYVVSLARRL